jgi:hypothetical protein
VQQAGREDDDPVGVRFDALPTLRPFDAQLAAGEAARLPVQEVGERQPAPHRLGMPVVAVRPEELAVPGASGLQLDRCDRQRALTPVFQRRRHQLADTPQETVCDRSHVVQHPRPAHLLVDPAGAGPPAAEPGGLELDGTGEYVVPQGFQLVSWEEFVHQHCYIPGLQLCGAQILVPEGGEHDPLAPPYSSSSTAIPRSRIAATAATLPPDSYSTPGSSDGS